MEIVMTPLRKTWILDLDGTIVKHNGYKIDGKDTLLPSAEKLLEQISEEDMLIILTSRDEEYRSVTEKFLKETGVRYNEIIFNAPYGERILINDRKPSGVNMAYAVNSDRDKVAEVMVKIDENL